MATRSVWFDNPSPPLDADDLSSVTERTWDLVVVGGGIIGLLSALRARQSGREVCLLDADRVGEGTTAHATVKVTSGHGALVAEIAARHDTAIAVAYQRANDAGFERLTTLIRAMPEDVGWTTNPHIVYATNDESRARLQAAALLAANAGSALARCEPPPWATGEAWSWADSALVQPVSLARALGRALQAAGVPVVEHARVVDVRDSRTTPRVRIDDGRDVRARDVLMASHAPAHDPDGHALRMEVVRHAAIAAKVGMDVPVSYGIDGMSTRPVMLADGSRGAVIVGPARRAGTMAPDAWAEVQDWATATLDAEPASHRWAAQDLRSFDLLPFVGRTRRSPHVLVTTGMNGWGFTNAAAAADLLPALLDEDPPCDDESAAPGWAAERVYPSGGIRDAAATAWWVGRSLVGDHAKAALPKDDLRPGEGRVVGGPIGPRAQCVTADGQRHCVSARCTHLGCLVRWNSVEESWDCPCHGSRFDPEGRVLEGPARTPLEQC